MGGRALQLAFCHGCSCPGPESTESTRIGGLSTGVDSFCPDLHRYFGTVIRKRLSVGDTASVNLIGKNLQRKWNCQVKRMIGGFVLEVAEYSPRLQGVTVDTDSHVPTSGRSQNAPGVTLLPETTQEESLHTLAKIITAEPPRF